MSKRNRIHYIDFVCYNCKLWKPKLDNKHDDIEIIPLSGKCIYGEPINTEATNGCHNFVRGNRVINTDE
jgi:hypothetical protein